MKPKVVLAYSGGLDTSVILAWLVEQGFDVVAYLADVGQQEDFPSAMEKARSLGATEVFLEDLKETFVKDYIFPALKANCIYDGRYLMGTSLARPAIAKKQVEIAKKIGATHLAHGATGKGNDQARFEFAYHALFPGAKIVSPWKDEKFLAKFKGRPDLFAYAKQHGIPLPVTQKKPYSLDANLFHVSFEAGKLDDPSVSPDEDMFQMTANPLEAPNKPAKLVIEFKQGVPVKVSCDTNFAATPLSIFEFLNALGGKHGVGRLDIVENRFVGVKSRGIYECPAGTLLWLAHRDLEGLTLDREVAHLKDELMPKLAKTIYNGLWFSPETKCLLAFVEASQAFVTGTVELTLFKGNAWVSGRSSPNPLYEAALSSLDEEGNFNQMDSKGFLNVHAIRLEAAAKQGALHEK